MAAALPTHLAACLRDVGAWQVSVDGDRVTFTGSAMGPAFGPFRNILAPFGSGTLEVDAQAREVRYRLRLVTLIAYATVATGVLAALLLAGHVPAIGFVLALPLFWTVLVGGPLVFRVLIFTGFLHRSIASAPRTPANS
jgi:hypothetical protein